MRTKNHKWRFFWGLSVLMSLCFVGCKDNDEVEETGFDPSSPVIISDFLPKKGGLGQELVIYGNNFGNDKVKTKVTIGGVEAQVINVKNTALYCFVPAKAYDGDIEVSILDEEGQEIARGECEEKFEYQKKMLVTTLLGTTYENNTKYDTKDGPFNDCGGFKNVGWLTFDPQSDSNILYAVDSETNGSCRVIDFSSQMVSTFKPTVPSGAKIASVSWTLNGDMLVTNNQSDKSKPGYYFFTRSSGFTAQTALWIANGARTAAVHPINGEVYYSEYTNGQVFKGSINPLSSVLSCKSPRGSAGIYMHIHPTGNFMYLVVNGASYILRSDYDWDNQTFTTPYLVAGEYNVSGYVDGVGAKARLNKPVQGAFVKKAEYEGQNDEYDFYFCDKSNHCIRILSPTGRVSTFAGTPQKNGFEEGDLRLEAKFKNPEGLLYDEKRQCFYVGDSGNRRIRKIALEE